VGGDRWKRNTFMRITLGANRIIRLFSNGPLSSTGYIAAGIRLPEIDRRGSVLLLARDPSKTELTYAVQISETLQDGTWVSIASSAGGAAMVATGDFDVSESGSPKVNVIVTDAQVMSAKRFFRLHVTSP